MKPRLKKLAAALPAPNPVLVRELRQMARNKFVSIGLCVYLFIQLLVALLAVLSQDEGSIISGAGNGAATATAHCSVLAILTLMAIPFFTGIRLTLETRGDNMDMQFATTLKPARFVDGKVASAAALALFFASATAPFLMLAYLLRGVDAGFMFATVALMIAASTLMSCLAVVVGSFAVPPWVRIALMLAIGLIIIPSSMISVILAISFAVGSTLIGTGGSFALGGRALFATLAFAVTIFALMRVMAAANLSPPHANRQLPLKRAAVIAWLGWGVGIVLANGDITVSAWGLGFAILGNLLLAGAVSMPGGCSRRVLAEVSPRPLRRGLQFLFFTSAENGICFSLTLLALTILIVNAFAHLFAGVPDARRITAIMFYAASYLLSARLLWRLVLKRFLSCRYVWFLALVLMLLGTLLPGFIGLSADPSFNADASFGNIGSMLFGSVVFGGRNGIIAAHAWMSTLWLSIMALTQIPSIIAAFRAFRPPAKKGVAL